MTDILYFDRCNSIVKNHRCPTSNNIKAKDPIPHHMYAWNLEQRCINTHTCAHAQLMVFILFSVVKLGHLGDYSLLGPRPRRFVVTRHITRYSVLLGLLGQLGDYSGLLGQKTLDCSGKLGQTNIFIWSIWIFKQLCWSI